MNCKDFDFSSTLTMIDSALDRIYRDEALMLYEKVLNESFYKQHSLEDASSVESIIKACDNKAFLNFLVDSSFNYEMKNNREVKEIPSPADIYEHISRTVIGHEDQKKRIIGSIYSFFEYRRKHVSAILLLGTTGIGKTSLIHSLGKYIGVDVYEYAANDFTVAGYDGVSVSEIRNRIKECESDSIIIYIDEIDKLSARGKERDGWAISTGVQSAFLKMIEEGIRQDTETEPYIFFIFSGAFTMLQDSSSETNNRSIGYIECNTQTKANELDLTTKLIREGGMLPEFIGRMSQIIRLKSLSDDEYRQIIRKQIQEYREYFVSCYDVYFLLKDEGKIYSYILDKIKIFGTGVWAIRCIFEETLAIAEYDIQTAHKPLCLILKYDDCCLRYDLVAMDMISNNIEK